MLASADHDLIRREPNMRGMRTVLDDSALLELFGSGGFRSLDVLSINYLRYKPNANCLVACEVAMGGAATHVYAVAYHDDVAADKLSNAERRLARFNGPGFLDHETRIAAFGFPVDLRLSELADVHDVDKLATLVQAKPISHQVLSYKPHRRCVTRVDVDGTPRAVLRCLLPDHYLQAKRVARHLPRPNLIRRPSLIHHSNRRRLLVTPWVEGTALSEFSGDEALRQVYRAGAALAELHTHHEPKLGFEPAAALREQLGRAMEMVARLLPARSEQLRIITANLNDQIAHHVRRCVVIHGDFHADQVIVADKLAFLDWDRAKNGDPEADLASFLAHERVRLAVTDRDVDWEAVQTALIDGYETTGEINSHRFNTYMAMELVKASVLPFRRRHADWPNKMMAILDLAAALANEGATTIPVSFPFTPVDTAPAPSRSNELLAEPWLQPALNRQVAEQTISANLAGYDQLDLDDIHVMRQKPGRRALLQYQFFSDSEDEFCVLGKVRAKCTDMRSADIQARLFEQIQRRQVASFHVPRPLGVAPELQMWLQECVSGRNAADLITPASDTDLTRRIAAALADLHQLELLVARQHSHADELAILRHGLTRVAEKRSEIASDVLLLLQQCEQLFDRFPAQLLTGIHRDFYPAQVICSGDRLTFVDFDLFATGDPLIDVGNFLAHLRETAIREHGAAAALAAHERVFAETYEAATNRTSHEAIQAHLIVGLARHVHISWAMSARKHATTAILSECLQLCHQMNQQTTSI